MTDFERALPHIRRSECRPSCVAGQHATCFVNDPDDPGGATCCGIIQRTYDAWRAQEKKLPPRPVQQHTMEELAEIYESRYWKRASCDLLPWPLSLVHFDAAVNHGTEAQDAKGRPKVNAGRLLQRAAGMPAPDGVVGAQTLAAIAGQDPLRLAYRYLLERFFRYDDLADQNPALLKFQTGGWEQRLEDLYHVIEKEAA